MAMILIWIVIAILFALFVILFLARVIKKKQVSGDLSDLAANQVFNFKEFLKTAYPAALIYTLLYVVFLFLCILGVFGSIEEDMNAAVWIPSLLALYVTIWLLLHILDLDCRSRNLPFATFLKTINTNTGVSAWNYTLLGISVVVLIASLIMWAIDNKYYICGPLFFAIMVSVLINLFAGSNAEWHVKAPSEAKWRPNNDKPEDVRIKAATQDGGEGAEDKKTPENPNKKTPVEREIKWAMKDKWGIDTTPEDNVKITLFKEDWEDPKQDMRKKNPFYGKDADGNMNWMSAIDDLSKSATIVLTGPDTNDENSEAIAIEKIVNSAIDVASKYNLAEHEVPELLLTFSQYGIKYIVDEDSSPLKQFVIEDEKKEKHLEYFRFAAETLYDKEGDCDCKSILACRLMKKLGADAKLVDICDKGSDRPSHAAIIFKDEYNRYKRCKKFPEYAYCEATSEGWKIGDVPEKLDENTLNILA